MVASAAMVRQRERQESPSGELVTVHSEEREELRARRKELGLKQEELARRIGVTAATISNLETGRHPQLRKINYAKLVRALRVSKQADTEHQAKLFEEIVAGAVDLDERDQLAVKALIDQLRILRKSGTTRPK